MNTALIIPIYNEKKSIKKIVEQAKKQVKRVIVVDNNSEDGTLKILKKLNIIFVSHVHNIGKSNSLKTGCKIAINLNAYYIAMMDGDVQHLIEDLKNIIIKIKKTKVDMVIGTRSNKKMPLINNIGTLIISNLVKFLFKKKLNDVQSGLRVFKSSVYKKIIWRSDGSAHYFADAEMTVNAIKNNLKIIEWPIKTKFFKKHQFKGMNLFQGVYLLICLIIWKIS